MSSWQYVHRDGHNTQIGYIFLLYIYFLHLFFLLRRVWDWDLLFCRYGKSYPRQKSKEMVPMGCIPSHRDQRKTFIKNFHNRSPHWIPFTFSVFKFDLVYLSSFWHLKYVAPSSNHKPICCLVFDWWFMISSSDQDCPEMSCYENYEK